jgi:HlyD family secretion protein
MKKIYVLILAGLAALSSCKKEPATFKVATRPVNEAVYASGEIMPEAYELIKATSSQRVLQILVKQGEQVQRGQVLAVLGQPSQNTQLGILNEQLRLARKNASDSSARSLELRQKAVLAKQQYDLDLAEAKKYQELSADKAVPEQEAGRRTMKAQESLAEYKNLQFQYEALLNDQKEKVLSVSQQLAELRQLRETNVLTSSIDGKVFSIYLTEGSTAAAGEPVLLTGSASRFKLELLVDERDIAQVKLGQKVIFETDAFEGKQFTATVTKIVPVIQKENRSFKVEAEVEGTGSFFPQSSVEANILIREQKDALAIPGAFLQPGDSVYTAGSDGKILKRKVRAGVRNGQWIEIRHGLKAGELIYEKAP